jgi:glyceraldehyde 3-phosphate dehydrogenase
MGFFSTLFGFGSNKSNNKENDKREKQKIKVAINGFGRIGRTLARAISKTDDIELVAINDIASSDMIEYLAKYDSVAGTFDDVKIKDNILILGDTEATILNIEDNQELDFAKYGAEVVFECSGKNLTSKSVSHHIDKGIKKVIISAPPKDESTPAFVLGVNEQDYQGEQIVSNASCTTNCLGVIAKIIDDNYSIKSGMVTTIHSYTNDQNILDTAHKSDKRRSRASAINMIPTSTGVASSLKLVIPNMDGKIHAQSIRVPTANVSMVDFNVILEKDCSKEEILELFNKEANLNFAGLLSIDDEFKVSQDIQGDTHSAIVASDLIEVIDNNHLKIMAWYDNENGYSNRLIELARYISDEKFDDINREIKLIEHKEKIINL